MKFKKSLSYLFIFASFVLIASPIRITGNAISSELKAGNLFFGISFLVFGIVLFLISAEGKLEKNLAQEIKQSGRVIDKPKELIHIAQEMGYVLGKEVREGIPVHNSYGDYITVIPKHKVTWRISKNIINELAKGESNFRRRNY